MDETKNTINFFKDRVEETLVRNRFTDFKRNVLFKLLLKRYFSDCKNILDLGCGKAQFMDMAEKICPEKEIEGIDLNKFSTLRKNVYQMDYRDLKKSYEGIFCYGVLEHTNPFDLYSALEKNCSKTLALITEYPTKKFWDLPDHIRPYTRKSLMFLNRLYGFKTIFCRRITFTSILNIARKKVV